MAALYHRKHSRIDPDGVLGKPVWRNNIRKMKRGAQMVNASRGPVIQEPDLIDALTKWPDFGRAGLDVFEQEPLPIDSPPRSMPNVLLTSHAASYSRQSMELLQIKAAEAARDFLGQAPRKPVGLDSVIAANWRNAEPLSSRSFSRHRNSLLGDLATVV